MQKLQTLKQYCLYSSNYNTIDATKGPRIKGCNIMKITPWTLATITSCTILLASCTTANKNPTQMANNLINRQSVTPLTHQVYPAKKAESVAFYTNKVTPNSAYRIIGIATVSKKNIFGATRQNETLNQMMKKLAASIGGDGVIEINQTDNAMEAKVIVYQKILI